MVSIEKQEEYYRAFCNGDSQYNGIFFTGVKSTKIFCRPTCPAKKPKRENCEFFENVQQSLLAGYRPCKRCRPLATPNAMSEQVETLVAAVERDPHRRWKDSDLREMGYDPSTIRRQFQQHFAMTFVAYARAFRLGEAFGKIRTGGPVIDAQLEAAYDSGSGFRDAFAKLFGQSPKKFQSGRVLRAAWTETALGPMLALADNEALHLLEFVDRRGLEKELESMRRHGYSVVPGQTTVTQHLQKELDLYFQGQLTEFTTPLFLHGSEFQRAVLKELLRIPYADTRSYGEQASRLGRPQAVRAVARANGRNQLAIIVPCHRVLGANGDLTGYSGGLARKSHLLDLEKRSQGQPKGL